jgi:hypothetical protein
VSQQGSAFLEKCSECTAEPGPVLFSLPVSKETSKIRNVMLKDTGASFKRCPPAKDGTTQALKRKTSTMDRSTQHIKTQEFIKQKSMVTFGDRVQLKLKFINKMVL